MRSELRARWRSWTALVLLVGLTGGLVLAAAAGARRTDTAYPRFLRETRASDALVSPMRTGLTGYYDALSRLPGVAGLAPMAGIATPVGPGGRPDVGTQVVAATDGRIGTVTEAPKLLAGRMPHPGRADEVLIDPTAAAAYHLGVGGRLDILAFPPGAEPEPGSQPDLGRALRLHERVVGIGVTRTNIVAITPLDTAPSVLGTPALFHRVLPVVTLAGLAYDGAYVRLRPGTTPAALGRAAQSLAARFPDTGGQVFVADEAEQAASVQRAIHPEAVALALFALLVALAALLIVGQVASRNLFVAATEYPTLRTLGLTRRQLVAAALAEVGLTAAAGAVVAVLSAVALSPRTPIGPARLAEPSPGVAFNAAVLIIGAAAIVALAVARAAWPAWRLARTSADASAPRAEDSRARPSRVAGLVGSTPGPLAAATGMRFAVEPGRGRSSVPVRSALAGTALAVAAVTTAVTFGTNLTRLVGTPHQYGKNWDVALDAQFGSIALAQFRQVLAEQRHIVAWAGGNHGTVEIEGQPVTAIGLAPVEGPIPFPTLLEGRQPAAADEIVLGTKTLRRIHRQVGDTVAATVNGTRHQVQIVGRAVFPAFELGSFTPTDLGDGAAGLAALFPAQENSGATPFQPPPQGPQFNFALVRFADGPAKAGDVARLSAVFTRLTGCGGERCGFLTSQRPADISNYARVEATPLVLAGVVGLLGVAALSQLLVMSTRRRRRDLAVMKTLGLLRRQVSAVVAWQATAVSVVALAVGIPVGVAAGRWLWRLFAGQLGVGTGAAVPFVAMVVAVPAVVLIANAVAAGPGWIAGRLHPAVALRTE